MKSIFAGFSGQSYN